MLEEHQVSNEFNPVSKRKRGLLFFALEFEASAVFREISSQGGRSYRSPTYRFPTSFQVPLVTGVNCDESTIWDWTSCVLGPGEGFEKHLWEYFSNLLYKPDWVILSGFSGGLGQSAQVGKSFEIVKVREESFGDECSLDNFRSDLNGLDSLGCATIATSLHVHRVLANPGDKILAHQKYSCDLVDMESLFFKNAMKKLDIAHSILRVVSDGPNEIVPQQAIQWMNEYGGLRPGRLVWDLICNPWLLRDLKRMADGSFKAGENLGKLVFQALQILSAT